MSDSPFLEPSGGGKWTDSRLKLIPLYKEQIAELLSQGVFVSEISAKLDISLKTIRLWKQADREFAERCADAETTYMDTVEREAIRRAVTGVEEVVVSQGKIVTFKDDEGKTVILRQRKFSDSLIMFVLKGRRRDVYGDQSKVDQTVRMDLTGVKDALHRKLAEAVGAREQKALPGPADG